jgi:CubicO group peptidase (beta-lactamase class C family)
MFAALALLASIAAVDTLFEPFAKEGSPGCAVGIAQRGEVVHLRAYGAADLERDVPLTPASVFNVGSLTKQFTAYLIHSLADEGKLTLEDDVRRFIPELREYGAPIRIRHLLHHTSGVRDYIDLFELAGKRAADVTTHAETVQIIARQRGLNFPTGTKHEYSNSNYVLLGEVVQRITAKPLREVARERIFGPLQMTHSQLVDDHRRVVRGRALAYTANGDGTYAATQSNAERLGAGGMHTTVADLLAWDLHLARGGAIAARMQERGRLDDGTPIDYGGGLFVETYRGRRAIRHGGSTAGYRAELMRLPELQTTVAVLCNLPSTPRPTQLAQKIADLLHPVDDSPAPPASAPAPSTPPADFAAALGDYWNENSGQVRRLVVKDGQPLLVIDPFSRARLTATGPTSFRFGANTIEVSTRGGRWELTVRWSDGRTETYVELRRTRPTAKELATYAGRYFSEELDAHFTVSVRDGSLVVARPHQEERVLEPTVRDRFSDGQTRLRFTPNANGFTYSDADVDGIHFVRACAPPNASATLPPPRR